MTHPDPTLTSTMAPERDAAVRSLLIDQVDQSVVRPRRPARRLAIGFGTAVAVAATTAVLVLHDPTAQPAYAAWTAVPETAPGRSVDSKSMQQWASTCSDLGVGGLVVEGVPARPEAAAARKALVDRRGSYTYCVDVSPGTATESDPLMSISGLRAEAGPEEGTSRSWSTVFDRPYARPSGADVLVLGGDLKASDEPAEPGVIYLRAYQLFGMAGDDVSGVDIVLANGLRVTATVQDGIWGAWWPMDEGDPTDARLEVRSGDRTAVVDPASVRLPWLESES